MTNVETRILLSEAQDKVRELEAKLAEEQAATLGACDLANHLSRKLERADQRVTELEADRAGLRHTVTELENELEAVRGELIEALEAPALRVAELGAENATLREHASAMWSRWADSLWHGDDAARPAQPADCSTDAAWLVLFQRAADVLAEGAREIEAHEQKDAAVEAQLYCTLDGLSRLQQAVRGAL